jgi:hypothetical protein
MSTVERLSKQIKEPIMGQPLYKVNPWLMKVLEFEGVYSMAIPGSKLPECKQMPRVKSAAWRFIGFVNIIISYLFSFIQSILFSLIYNTDNVMSQSGGVQLSLADRIRIFNNEWRAKNSHCSYFGVYSFNLTRWKELDSSELRVWCNNTFNQTQRKFLTGYVRHSNLLMLIVEDEYELIHCGNITNLINIYTQPPFDNSTLLLNETFLFDENNNMTNNSLFEINPAAAATTTNPVNEKSPYALFQNSADFNFNKMNDESTHLFDSNNASNNTLTNDFDDTSKILKTDYEINRYRRKPESCNNFFENEREFQRCKSNASKNKISIRSVLLFFLCLFSSFFK